MSATINHVGKYQLKAVLGRTTLSTVYDGWDSDIARRVAVKLMRLSTVDDAESKEVLVRFKRGAQAAGQLNHPNIVAVFDYGETQDYAYLVMEYIDGPTLKALFDQHRTFSLVEIGRMFGGILDALQYSHEHRVVHRDVKPANIMFTKENVVKITDFGIARLEDSEVTQAGMVIGTPAYMSPEQFLGEKIDARTDIYSMGVLLYQALTGERPYEGTLATIMHKVLYETPLPPSRRSTIVTPALDQVVTRAMARQRADRFASAAEFKAALYRALESPSAAADPVGLATVARQPLGRTSRRRVAPALVLTSVAAVLIAAGGAAAWRFHRAPRTDVSAVQPVPANEASAVASSVPPAGKPSLAPAKSEAEAKTETSSATEAQALAAARVPAAQPPSEPGPVADEHPVSVAERPVPPPGPSTPEAGIADLFPNPLHRLVPSTSDAVGPVAVIPPPAASPPDKKPDTGSVAAKATTGDTIAGPSRRAAKPDRRGKPAPDLAHNVIPPVVPDRADDDAITETLRRLRNGVASKAEPPLTSRPEPSEEVLSPPVVYATTSSSPVGLLCQSVTPETAAKFGLDRARGMVVLGVTSGSAAAAAGIRQKDVILKINGAEVSDLSSLRQIARGGAATQTVPVEVLRHGSQLVLRLEVDQIRR